MDNGKNLDDPVSGVSAFHHANVVAVDSTNSDAIKAMTTCEQYAVVAFWGLTNYDDCRKC